MRSLFARRRAAYVRTIALLACLLALPLATNAAPARQLPVPTPAGPPLSRQPGLSPALGMAQTTSGSLRAAWHTDENDRTYSAAWGDVDGDGDLDLALSSYDALNRLYHNCAVRRPGDGCQPEDRYLSHIPVMLDGDISTTQSLAWGDVDGDGDLDLAAGNRTQPNRLYSNRGGQLVVESAWQPKSSQHTYSVAWGDADGDGDLDLAAGNNTGQNELYLNNDGVLQDTAMSFGPTNPQTRSVAWGDLDDDGDLDLAVGNEGTANQVYRNCSLKPDAGCAGAMFSGIVWTAPMTRTTNSVAWGDVNNDGRLDLAVGNYTEPSQIYLNHGGVLHPPQDLSTKPAGTREIAFGDANGDGKADLALANFGFTDANRSQLYLNNGISLTLDLSWQPAPAFTQSVAWADADNDGQLDLAVGNGCRAENVDECNPTQLYLNTTSVLSSAPQQIQVAGASSLAWGDANGDGKLDLALGWYGTQSSFAPLGLFLQTTPGNFSANQVGGALAMTRTLGVAWGDVDGDGDLDLAVASRESPVQIYHNDAGSLTLASLDSASTSGTTSVAWGDVDGDGDLDLAVGHECAFLPRFDCFGNQLFRNAGEGRLELDTAWSPPAAHTFGVAWGDVDGDGDLDLAAGNRDFPNQLYRNNSGVLSATPEIIAPTTNGTRSVAWGDVDGDGDLDLAVGNLNNSNQLYRNTGGQLVLDRSWVPEATSTYRLAWGDADGDGDLDLAVANSNEPPQLYRNVRGQLELDAGWSPASVGSYDVAWGDADGDGDLDLALANSGSGGGAAIYRNTRNALARIDGIPTVHVARPRPPADANFYSMPTFLEQQTIPLAYTLTHTAGMPVRRVVGEFSLDGGGHWQPAVATTDTPTRTLSSGRTYTYTWDLFASGVFGQSDNVVFRLSATPALSTTHGLPGPYLYGRSSTGTFPFRVRGTQVHVLDGAAPGVGALVYRLPAGQSSGGLPIADLSGRPAETDSRGYLPGRGVLALGDRLTALLPKVISDTYTLYDTNAAPTPAGTAAYTVTHAGVQTITVSAEHPLLLFNLNVSLEWDARHDPQFLSQLDYDLRRASELLYDWSDGQVALGAITVYQAKQNWDGAHIRVYATNRLRPNANKGGIVALERTDPLTSTVTYAPGQLRIGAVWNRYGESSGALGEDWPRTLAHELGHYLLFLDDNYIGLDAQGVLVQVTTCTGTAMADPYRDDYGEFHPEQGWRERCAQTLSHQETGRSDWATIEALYPQLRAPATGGSINPGPNVLPINLTRVHVVDPPAAVRDDTLETPIVLLARAEDGARYQPSATARAFLFQHASGTDVISDIVDLGRPTLDRVLLRGAHPGDRLCVYDLGARVRNPVDGHISATPRLGCREAISSTDPPLPLTLFDSSTPRRTWQPDLSITPVTSTTLAIGIADVPAGLTLHARLFPSFGISTTAELSQTLVPAQDGGYQQTFDLGTPAFAGYVHVWVEEAAPRREIVSDVTLIGSPAAGWGRGTPRGNPAAGWGRGAPLISSDGQVLLFARDRHIPTDQVVSIQATTLITPTPAWATPVGPAYRVATSAPTLQGLSISFSYLGGEVPPGEEPGLRIYAWDTATAQWQVLSTTLNLAQNAASAAIARPGLYALMSSLPLPIPYAGWNLVAYPAPDHAMPEALASIAGFYTTVYGYDPSDPADPWEVYDATVPPEWAALVNDLKLLRNGRGYWINATEPITALLRGGGDAFTLAAGPLASPPATFYGLAPAAASQSDLTVEARVGGVRCGQAQTTSLVLGGQRRVVFAVDVRAAGGAPDVGCGTPGQVVTIAFRNRASQLATLTAIWDNSKIHAIPSQSYSLYLALIRSNT